MKKRLLSALAAYAILAVLAAILLRGKVLAGVLILFGGLLLKTLIALKASPRVPD